MRIHTWLVAFVSVVVGFAPSTNVARFIDHQLQHCSVSDDHSADLAAASTATSSATAAGSVSPPLPVTPPLPHSRQRRQEVKLSVAEGPSPSSRSSQGAERRAEQLQRPSPSLSPSVVGSRRPAVPYAMAVDALLGQLDILRFAATTGRGQVGDGGLVRWRWRKCDSNAADAAATADANDGVQRKHRLEEELAGGALRLEVSVAGLSSPLDWLRVVGGEGNAADPLLLPRLFYRTPQRHHLEVDSQQQQQQQQEQQQKPRGGKHERGREQAQHEAYERLSLEFGGVGASHVVRSGRGATPTETWENMVNNAPPGARYFGGERFAHPSSSLAESSSPSPERNEASGGGGASDEWKVFGGHHFVLPLVEVSVCGNVDKFNGGNDGGNGEGGHANTVLAVNLRWDTTFQTSASSPTEAAAAHNTTTDQLFIQSENARRVQREQRERSVAASAEKAVALLKRLLATTTSNHPAWSSSSLGPPLRQPPALARIEARSQAQWQSSVESALGEIRSRSKGYDKVVLARRSDLLMASRPSPVELLAALRHDHGYLFMLELDENSADDEDGDSYDGAAGISRSSSSGSSDNDDEEDDMANGNADAAALENNSMPSKPSWLRYSTKSRRKKKQGGVASPVAFLGCSPEQLFEVVEGSGMVATMAVAGTRPRDLNNPLLDSQLGEDLMASQKDMTENRIVADFIQDRLTALSSSPRTNTVPTRKISPSSNSIIHDGSVVEGGDGGVEEGEEEGEGYIVQMSAPDLTKFKHVQHITRAITAHRVRRTPRPPRPLPRTTPSRPTTPLNRQQHQPSTLVSSSSSGSSSLAVGLSVLRALHPTPAVCGRDQASALRAICSLERGLDRGWYAGPIGVVNSASQELHVLPQSKEYGVDEHGSLVVGGCEFVVAIRSCLVLSEERSVAAAAAEVASGSVDVGSSYLLSGRVGRGRVGIFAGAGIVAASDPASEWRETETKMTPLLCRLAPLQLQQTDERKTVEQELGGKKTTLGDPSSFSKQNTPPEEEAAANDHPLAVVTPLFGGWDPIRELSSSRSMIPNLNALWASALVEELERLGVTLVVVCPGSRSTPIATALARHTMGYPSSTSSSSSTSSPVCGMTRLRTLVHHDERGAAFTALGFAKATGRPAVVLTTSGTAVANLLPACVEASQAGVPLLLLTADRGPEARSNGANQAIALQAGMLGVYGRHTADLPCPTPELPLTYLLEEVDKAVAITKGPWPGPVHINMPFRENLAPDPGAIRGDWRQQQRPQSDKQGPKKSSRSAREVQGQQGGGGGDWDRSVVNTPRFRRWFDSGKPLYSLASAAGGSVAGHSAATASSGAADGSVLASLLGCVRRSVRGVVVAGPLSSPAERSAVALLARTLRWPVVADLQSGLRYGHGNTANSAAGRGVAMGGGGGAAKRSGLASNDDNAAQVAAPWLIPAHDVVVSHPLLASSSLLPDVVLQFGHPLTSAQLLAWFSKASNAADPSSSSSSSGYGGHDPSLLWAHAVVTSSLVPPGKCDPSSTTTHHLSSSNTLHVVKAIVEMVQATEQQQRQQQARANRARGSSSESSKRGVSHAFPPSKLLCLRSLGVSALRAIEHTVDSKPRPPPTNPSRSLRSHSATASDAVTAAAKTAASGAISKGVEAGGDEGDDDEGGMLGGGGGGDVSGDRYFRGRRESERMKTTRRARKQQQQQQQGVLNDNTGPVVGDAALPDALSEPWLCRAVTKLMGQGDPRGALFVSASMPVRDMDSLGFFESPFLNDGDPSDGQGSEECGAVVVGGSGVVVANRGASGIDGILSSALGFALGHQAATTLLVGDQACLHDLNALHVMAQLGGGGGNGAAPSGGGGAAGGGGGPSNPELPPLTIVVVNNGGGAIFDFLPIAKHGASVQHSHLFSNAHRNGNGPALGAAAAALGIGAHHTVATKTDFANAYSKAMKRGRRLAGCAMPPNQLVTGSSSSPGGRDNSGSDGSRKPTNSAGADTLRRDDVKDNGSGSDDDDDVDNAAGAAAGTAAGIAGGGVNNAADDDDDAAFWETLARAAEEEFDGNLGRVTVIEAVIPFARAGDPASATVAARRAVNQAGATALEHAYYSQLPLRWHLTRGNYNEKKGGGGEKDRRQQQQCRSVVVLLHGFMGCKEDWGPFETALLQELRVEGVSLPLDLLSIDLPYHGSSLPQDSEGSRLLPEEVTASLPFAAGAVLHLLDSLGYGSDADGEPPHVTVVGYSLGGRVAYEMAARTLSSSSSSPPPPVTVDSVIAIGAHPGFQNDEDDDEDDEDDDDDGVACGDASIAEKDRRLKRVKRQGQGQLTQRRARQRQAGDGALASHLSNLPRTEQAFEGHLREWYSLPLWGNLNVDTTATTPVAGAVDRVGVEASAPSSSSSSLLKASNNNSSNNSSSSKSKSSNNSSDSFPALLRRRVRSGRPWLLAPIAQHSSVARQRSHWEWMAQQSSVDVLFLHGAEDAKFEAVGAELRQRCGGGVVGQGGAVAVAAVAGAAHAVVEQAPTALAKLVAARLVGQDAIKEEQRKNSDGGGGGGGVGNRMKESAISGDGSGGGGKSSVSQGMAEAPLPSTASSSWEVSSVSWQEWRAPLSKPMQLSSGAPITERRGLEVQLQMQRIVVSAKATPSSPSATAAAIPAAAAATQAGSVDTSYGHFHHHQEASDGAGGGGGAADVSDGDDNNEEVVVGVGEVSPLPGFHLESLSQAHAQVKVLADAMAGQQWPQRVVDAVLDLTAASSDQPFAAAASGEHASNSVSSLPRLLGNWLDELWVEATATRRTTTRRRDGGASRLKTNMKLSAAAAAAAAVAAAGGEGEDVGGGGGVGLHPSVRCGFEQACLHALAKQFHPTTTRLRGGGGSLQALLVDLLRMGNDGDDSDDAAAAAAAADGSIASSSRSSRSTSVAPVFMNSLVLRSGDDEKDAQSDEKEAEEIALGAGEVAKESGGVGGSGGLDGLWEEQDAEASEDVIKVKVGAVGLVAQDAARVTNILRTATANYGGGKVGLRLDANQGWTLQEAVEFWALLPADVKEKVRYVEEPLRPSSLENSSSLLLSSSSLPPPPSSPVALHLQSLAALHRRCGMPIALDETLLALLSQHQSSSSGGSNNNYRSSSSSGSSTSNKKSDDDDKDKDSSGGNSFEGGGGGRRREESRLGRDESRGSPCFLDSLTASLTPPVPSNDEQAGTGGGGKQNPDADAGTSNLVLSTFVSALVLKPSLLGVLNTVALVQWARLSPPSDGARKEGAVKSGAGRRGSSSNISSRNEIECVVSSAFDGDVGLAHLALLASAVDATKAATKTTRHGLSTFSVFAASASPSLVPAAAVGKGNVEAKLAQVPGGRFAKQAVVFGSVGGSANNGRRRVALSVNPIACEALLKAASDIK